MKYILSVLFFFLLVSLGIGVYFFQRSQNIGGEIKASQATNVLSVLIDDCNFRYLHPCQNSPEGVGLEPYVLSQSEKILRANAPASVQNFRETIDPTIFAGVDVPSSLQLTGEKSTAQIISNTALATHIHHRLLIALLSIQGESAWRGRGPLSSAFGRNEFGFAGQLVGVAKDLSSILAEEITAPSTSVSVDQKTYLFEQNLNPSSRALYVYFSRNVKDSSEFEQLVGLYNKNNRKNFWNTWRSLYQDASFSDHPYTPIVEESETVERL